MPRQESSRDPCHAAAVAAAAASHEASLSPFEANRRNPGNGCQPWVLPGEDGFPGSEGSFVEVDIFRPDIRCDRFVVEGEVFIAPVNLFLAYPIWAFLAASPPVHGWVLDDVAAPVFSILLRIMVSPRGFVRTEPGLNLPLLVAAMGYADSYDMDAVTVRLAASIFRYIALRVFFCNPYASGPGYRQEYYVYRSEEIYRTWVLLGRHPRCQLFFRPSEVISLYFHCIPEVFWDHLTTNFDRQFRDSIEAMYSSPAYYLGPAGNFDNEQLRWFTRAGFSQAPWLQERPRAFLALVPSAAPAYDEYESLSVPEESSSSSSDALAPHLRGNPSEQSQTHSHSQHSEPRPYLLPAPGNPQPPPDHADPSITTLVSQTSGLSLSDEDVLDIPWSEFEVNRAPEDPFRDSPIE